MVAFFNNTEVKTRNKREEKLVRIALHYIDDIKQMIDEGDKQFTIEFYMNELNGLCSAMFYLEMCEYPIKSYTLRDF